MLQRVDHAVQMSKRPFDIEVFVLPRPALSTEDCTTMDYREVAVGEFVVSFCVFIWFVVDSQMPFSVLPKSVQADELVFLLCGSLVFAPVVPLVEPASLLPQVLGRTETPVR